MKPLSPQKVTASRWWMVANPINQPQHHQALKSNFLSVLKSERILAVDDSRLLRGDLAVTADGLHVLAYLEWSKSWRRCAI